MNNNYIYNIGLNGTFETNVNYSFYNTEITYNNLSISDIDQVKYLNRIHSSKYITFDILIDVFFGMYKCDNIFIHVDNYKFDYFDINNYDYFDYYHNCVTAFEITYALMYHKNKITFVKDGIISDIQQYYFNKCEMVVECVYPLHLELFEDIYTQLLTVNINDIMIRRLKDEQ